jgi:pilus assembly protein CpaB
MLLLGVAVAMGLLAALLVRTWLQSQSRVQANSGTVVVASTSIAFGTPITEDKIKELPWPAGNIPQGVFSSKKELLSSGRRIVLASFSANEPILASKITAPGQRGTLSALLEEGMRAVTVRVDDVRGVGGFILPGDRVDVVLIRGDASEGSGGAGRSYADIILQNVKVMAVDQLVNDRPDQPNLVAKAVTLALQSEEAQKIVLAQNIGRLSLTLRQSGEERDSVSRRITEKDLVIGPPPTLVAAPSTPQAEPAPRRNDAATVVIIRGLKREEYAVVHHD